MRFREQKSEGRLNHVESGGWADNERNEKMFTNWRRGQLTILLF